jgi:aryl-alcohol dehydrogenase-like predicted oxidoreductase
MPQLCLGTAQFGMNYGITNHHGKVSTSEIAQILRMASEHSISYVDTAKVYGDAEVRLGDNAPKKHDFKYITKLPSQTTSAWSLETLEVWETNFNDSLSCLKATAVDTLLLHSVNDLSHQDSHLLVDWLLSLKTRKMVKNIGISIYNSADLVGVDLNHIDVVQLPLSIYDQRCLLDGTIDFLHSSKVQIFARSIFLQGLILADASIWPAHLSNDFRDHHRKWLQFIRESSKTPLEAVLTFMNNLDQLTGFIVGINSLSNLEAILNVWLSLESRDFNLSSGFHWHNPVDLDPRKWPSP